MPFQCTVVTPEQQAFDAQATQVILPGFDGLIGILQDRAPLLMKVGTGPLRIDIAGGRSQFFVVDGGIAQMKDNKLTILTQVAQPTGEITMESARAELAEAEARVASDEKTREIKARDLARARAKVALVGK